MDEKKRKELSDLVGCLEVDSQDGGGDNLGVVLATYFHGHRLRPERDPIDEEVGWGHWVLAESYRALGMIADLIEEREANLRAALAAATERAEAAERTVARLRDLLDAIDTMIPSEVTRDGADADEMVADLATAWRAAIARADALAARLAEVDDREHPA